MSKQLAARRTLEDAEFYANLARKAEEQGDREALRRHLTTAIAYARSVTDHLCKELKPVDGFMEWGKPRWDALQEDALWCFFRDQRNFSMHKGPLRVGRIIRVCGDSISMSTATCIARVIRGKPWYRRRLRILWQDFRGSDRYRRIRSTILRPLRRVRGWLRALRPAVRRPQPQSPPRPVQNHSNDTWHFVDDEWGDHPALDLVEEHLQQLEAIVLEAERRFCRSACEDKE